MTTTCQGYGDDDNDKRRILTPQEVLSYPVAPERPDTGRKGVLGALRRSGQERKKEKELDTQELAIFTGLTKVLVERAKGMSEAQVKEDQGELYAYIEKRLGKIETRRAEEVMLEIIQLEEKTEGQIRKVEGGTLSANRRKLTIVKFEKIRDDAIDRLLTKETGSSYDLS